MATFNWEEYKEFKKHTHEEDKLKIAIDFIKSYYNINSPTEMYKMLLRDDIGEMMLNKRDIDSPESFETFMFKQ